MGLLLTVLIVVGSLSQAPQMSLKQTELAYSDFLSKVKTNEVFEIKIQAL